MVQPSETPTMLTASMASRSYNNLTDNNVWSNPVTVGGNVAAVAAGFALPDVRDHSGVGINASIWPSIPRYPQTDYDIMDRLAKHAEIETKIADAKARHRMRPFNKPQEKQDMAEVGKPTARLVQVFIADPDENLPLDKRLIYKGEQKFTDLTDQELFFEVEINSILATHNELRVKTLDKSIKTKERFLEPIRIRDLRMVVVNIATF